MLRSALQGVTMTLQMFSKLWHDYSIQLLIYSTALGGTIQRVPKLPLPMCRNFQISAWEIENVRLTWLTTIRKIFVAPHFHMLFVVGSK